MSWEKFLPVSNSVILSRYLLMTPLWVWSGGGVHSTVKLVEVTSITSSEDGGADGAAETMENVTILGGPRPFFLGRPKKPSCSFLGRPKKNGLGPP